MLKKIFLILLGSLLLPVSESFAAEEITLEITEDAYVDSIQFYDIVGLNSKVMLGFGDTTGSGITRTFLKYSNQNLLNRGITPDQIERAMLRMYQYRNKYGTDYEVIVGESGFHWDENILNWNTQPPISNSQLKTQTITSALNWKELDVTDIVKQQLWDFENSHGLVIYAADEMISGGSFWSSNCIDSIFPPFCNEPLFPHIIITLKEDAELELVLPKSAAELTKEVSLQWEFNKEDELYMAEVSDDSNFTDILLTSNWIKEKSFPLSDLESKKYYWRVKTYFTQLTSQIRSFSFSAPKKEGVTDESPQKSDDSKNPDKTEQPSISQPEVKGAVAPPQFQQPLGFCKYKYNSTNRELTRIRCKLEQPEVPRIDHVTTKEGVYWLDTEVTLPTHMEIFIEYTICKPKTLFDPRTWFWCAEEVLETSQEIIPITGSIWTANQGKKIDAYRTKLTNGKYTVNFPIEGDLSGKNFQIIYSVRESYQLEDGFWVEIFEFSPKSNNALIPKVSISKSDTHPYRFPFEKMVGVTQWYGDTEYQSPHTGIDFGAVLESVYAPADGRIVYAGWDNGKNKCLSGGNYVLIEHKGGKHTIFLHLKDFINENGKKWKAGDKVVKGQKIGTTGNTGLYNCEPLGYHLHFETRTSRSFSSHTNPVPLVNADWNKVLTLGYGSYPGRLTGENPHPGK